MKTFLAVFAVILLAFGASILYYRGDFGGQKNSTKPANQVTDNGNVADVNSSNITQPANPPKETKVLAETTTTFQFVSLEIKQVIAGNIKVGQSMTFTVLGKDKDGKKATVPAAWLLSDTSVASLDKNEGEEVVLTGLKIGKTKLTAAANNLNTSVNLVIVAAPVLAATTTSNTGVGTTTPAATVQIKPYAIYLFDPNGNRFNVGETRTFTSQVQYTDNSVKTPDLNWSLDPSDLGSLDHTSGSSVTFKANRSGNGSLKAVFGNLTSSLQIQVN